MGWGEGLGRKRGRGGRSGGACTCLSGPPATSSDAGAPRQAAMSMSHLYGQDEEGEVEMESFEITDWDLQNEFNPNRQRHRQTKEEATYGIWAERDSDDERPSFGGKRYGRLLAARGVTGAVVSEQIFAGRRPRARLVWGRRGLLGVPFPIPRC